MIKPVLRYAGSKYRKIDKIIDILGLKKIDAFLDMFGGSGIVGVNVKDQIGCNVIINDFDNMFPITANKAIQNMISFQGMGKNFTKQALEYFNRRIENGYWDKLDKYNEILKECEITNIDWTNRNDISKFFMNTINIMPNKIYVDPPYDGITGLYKSSYDEEKHKYLKFVLDTIIEINEDLSILISYNDTPFIRELYKDWFIYEEEFQYSSGGLDKTRKKKKVNELFITNFEVKNEREILSKTSN